jgi:uncharacterized protein YfaS (alpha-2-macroglobulin family)
LTSENDGDQQIQQIWGYSYSFRKEQKEHLQIIMTDRPVYRLGDTVQFCCLAYIDRATGKEYNRHRKPAARVDLVAVMDYFDRQDTLYLTTDEHGRCWGQFVIPSDDRNGAHWLSVFSKGKPRYRADQRIYVEAYKPPRFFVSLSSHKDSADSGSLRRFGQPVTLYGTVSSFSGAPMEGQ